MRLSIHTTVLLALFNCAVFAQPKADPYKPTNGDTATTSAKAAPANPKKDGPVNLSTCMEVFSIPMEMAAAMQRENLDDAECYKRIIDQLKDESVKQEVFMVVRSRSGEQATNDAIVEQHYPSGYDKPTVPDSLTVGAGNNKDANSSESIEGFYTPSNPTDFETRNTGEMLDIEVSLSPDQSIGNVRMIPEQVLLAGFSKFGHGTSRCEMPIYETRRLASAFTVTPGKPFLIGTLSRPSNSQIDPDAANKASFAFITVRVVPVE